MALISRQSNSSDSVRRSPICGAGRRLAAVRGAGLLSFALLGACASQIPQAIRNPPADNPPVAAVRDDTAAYEARRVRWGGVILATDNRESSTRLTILARPLDGHGRPEDSDDSEGRFIAIVQEFLEPSVYAADRKVTVSGILSHSETGRVGEFPYTYPVVRAETVYLWPKEIPVPAGYYPWWYDPWYYDPWYTDRYPYRRYPYR
jgi:outer membrane lipoprotein